MFGNRAFGWKLVAALAVIAGLGLLSERRVRSIQPGLWDCLSEPDRWDGAGLRLQKADVVSSDTSGFEIESKGLRARVVPAAPVAPGDTVDLSGTFLAQGPQVRAKEVRKVEPGTGKRRLAEALSIGVLGLILLNFLRHFAFRAKAAQIAGAD